MKQKTKVLTALLVSGLFALAPIISYANTLATDSFIRANENPLSQGGNWHVESSIGNPLQLVSNKAVASVGNASNVSYYDAGITWPNDQFVQATLSFGATVADIVGMVLCRVDTSGHNWYEFGAFLGTYRLYLFQNGSATLLGTGGVPATGDVLKINCQGTTITGLVNGATSVTATDATVSAGKPALLAFKFLNIGDESFTAWSAGDFNSGAAPSKFFLIFSAAPFVLIVARSRPKYRRKEIDNG